MLNCRYAYDRFIGLLLNISVVSKYLFLFYCAWLERHDNGGQKNKVVNMQENLKVCSHVHMLNGHGKS